MKSTKVQGYSLEINNYCMPTCAQIVWFLHSEVIFILAYSNKKSKISEWNKINSTIFTNKET